MLAMTAASTNASTVATRPPGLAVREAADDWGTGKGVVMLRKRQSPKRRPPLLVTSNLVLPTTIMDWEWDLLVPLLAAVATAPDGGARRPTTPEGRP